MNILNCRGKILDLSTPKIMGILNVTPDSFYDGGKYNQINSAIEHAGNMLEQGAEIIDLGVASSKPGATNEGAEMELERLQELLPELINSFPNAIFSIDTYWKDVAQFAYENGVHILNDISAFEIDPKLLDFIKESKMAYILMHMKGTPNTMQMNPSYKDVVSEILKFFIHKLRVLKANKIYDVILDPGFGFGKTIDHNYEILEKLSVFQMLEKPVLVGISRKSMIYKLLGTDPEDSLNGTCALNLQALLKGAKILRVHDVKEAKQMIEIAKKLSEPKTG